MAIHKKKSPNNKKGKEILKLIKIAWKRKLMFRIGSSITRNLDNVIVWNGIHMKTSLSGGPRFHGWPDKDYFERVKKEFKTKGISLSDVEEESE